MSLPVDVRSVQTLSDFRAGLCRFGEDVKNALAAAEMEISRMIDWVTNDRRLYWQGEIHRRREEVSRAKSELFRKRTSQMFGHEASYSEQRDNLREANVRLEQAEKKLERVRQWAQPLQQAIMEYRAAARPMADMIDADLARGLALLERMIRALEQYTAAAPPTTSYVQSFRAGSSTAVADGISGAARGDVSESSVLTPARESATDEDETMGSCQSDEPNNLKATAGAEAKNDLPAADAGE